MGAAKDAAKDAAKLIFRSSFDEFEPSFPNAVKAVALAMNTSYYLPVAEKLPQAAIVYDCYDMQA